MSQFLNDSYLYSATPIIPYGGDTDTTAAILGDLIEAFVGKSIIPTAWLKCLWEYPRTVKWIELLAKILAPVFHLGTQNNWFSTPAYGLLLRNLLFMIVVRFYGLV